jgi:hypothetical protein
MQVMKGYEQFDEVLHILCEKGVFFWQSDWKYFMFSKPKRMQISKDELDCHDSGNHLPMPTSLMLVLVFK